MCLAVPGKVVKLVGNVAKVDFGHGATREVDVSLVDVEEGQYVLVHVGYAIKVLDDVEAEETLRLWREILGSAELGQSGSRGA
ncbi:MAG: HypC/HybG/HupF family hydrogenase formation chaperone [Candidatus Bathyarchaeia archaeon]